MVVIDDELLEFLELAELVLWEESESLVAELVLNPLLLSVLLDVLDSDVSEVEVDGLETLVQLLEFTLLGLDSELLDSQDELEFLLEAELVLCPPELCELSVRELVLLLLVDCELLDSEELDSEDTDVSDVSEVVLSVLLLSLEDWLELESLELLEAPASPPVGNT